ncbi:MAG: SprB repeat-containing protein, partial [Flavobacteriales bacterium]|nr:SprB repeat-containing protein [Flavobacteriales bacterium]
TATVTPSGGTPLYTYLWSTSPVQTTATATGLVAGLYTLTVTDFKGCSTTANITIGEPTPLIATITSATDVSCFGGTDGDATATAINGTAPYTYLWNTNPVQTNVSATGLSAGIYTVTITDTNGCNATANVIINNPSPLSLSIAIVTLPSNCGASDGEACVATTGGLTPYTYFWNTSPVQNTACATGLPTGSISIIVSDSNGCAIAGVAVIGDLNVVIALDSVQDVTCYGGNDGQVSITVSGATPPYTYLWDDPNSQTTPVATGLTAGTYLITVTDPNNCGSALSITVNQPLPIIDSIATTDLTCFGDKTGQATVTSSGEYPPYTYLWNTAPPQNAATATGLSGGGYTVIVTDGRGCATSSIVNISQPNLLTANISSTNVSCNGVNDGSAVVTGTGGVSPYSYLWNPGGQTTAAVNNLQPLNYTVTVTDVNGCDTSATVTITEPTGLTLSLTGTNVSCNGFCDGQIVANLSGGTPVYTYFWSTTPFQSNATATGLCPGNYTLTALDSNGCDTTANATITEPPLLTGSITSVNHVTCNGANDGDASVTPSGGTLPYSYLWNDPSAQTDSTAVGLFAGTYTVAVTDGNGCSILKTVTVIEPGLLTSVVGGSTNISCNGADDGQATVTTTGGTPTYTYLWNDPSAQTTSTAVGLAPGNYSVTISDINGCSTVTNTNITEPAVLTAAISGSGNMSCFGVNDGSITVVGLGGTAPYSYLWDDISVQSTATANGLSAGSYTVIVTDANGCDTTATDSIIEPPLLTQSITSVFDVGCTGACDGVASVAASGGTPGYTYVWSTTPFQSNDTATGLCPGAYPVTVADTNGCTVADTVIINEPAILTASILPPVIHVSCKGGNDGAATVLALGGSPPYSYLWNDPSAQTTATASGLVAGTYTVVVTDSNSCNSSGNVTVTINEPAQFLAISIIDSLDVSCNGGSDGEAIALASGGTPFYTYLWGVVPPQFTATATGLLAGTYAVTVLDGNGCDTTATVTINEPTVLAITFTDSVNVSCKGGNDGSATVGVSGGMTPYSYLWNTNPAQTDTAAIGLVGGTYTVTVTDSNNCAVSVSISITDPDSLSLSITETAANCGNPDGAASVAVTGGTSPFSYLWSSGGVTNDSIAGLFAGVYTVNVTDAKGCIDSAIALVNDIVVFVVQDSTANLTCFGGSNGTIDILVTSGTRPFTYDWSHDSLVNDTFVTGLAAGVYYLTVTDSNGCKSTKQFNISGPVAILDSIDIQNVTCNGDSNGQAAVFPIGGTPPYSYLWNTVPPQTDSFATGLDAGTYNITVTDSLGCDTVTIISIIEPDTLTATITSVTNASCNGLCDGSATVSSLGGTSPIGYSWDTSPVKIDSTATGLCPGAYTVTLMDVNGCLANADTVIAEPDTLSVSMINVVNVSCSGYQDGQATASAIGGTPGYGFLWTSVTPVQMDSIATGLGPITHTVTVTDTNGCSATATVTITEPGVFAASLGVVTHVSCNGGNDGSASAIPFGGTTPYSYSWSTAPLQTDSTAIGLSAGTDTVIVSDLNGCSDTVTVTINEPPLLTASITDSINISCFGGNNGEATVTAGGGSGLYAYLWSDSNTQTTQTAIGLLAGNYSVTITDDDSCSSIVNVTLTEPSQLTASITSSINVSCGGGNDGLMVVSGTGGTPPYTYLWDDDSTQVSDSAIALNAGIYTVIITDTMGCDTSASDTITEP